ncbi:MAG: addiction module protein [Bacteroidales bacterium]|nr:addiction module protein [Bacteroidales bacterium]MCF8458077.1 addiction module protein [Bacteroidales bacterium]
MNIDQITLETLRLNVRERALLAETIWESLDSPNTLSSDISDEEAISLARQRDREIEKGEVDSLTHNELMNRLRK